MKRDADYAIPEIKRRGIILRQRHEQRIVLFLSAATFTLSLALIGMLGVLTGSGIAQTQSRYGSIRLSVEQCGYILVAVVALSLGIVLTLLIQKYGRKRNADIDGNNADSN